MQNLWSLFAAGLLLAAPLLAQEEVGKKEEKQAEDKERARPTSAKYTNDELGISFAGVYGWARKFAEGSGAWTELARYRSDQSLDSTVVLYVRDNPYETANALRKALEAEFKEGEVYKEISFSDVTMKKGVQLPGIQVEAFRVLVTKEGKKRERKLVVRTYFGKNRLFRVYCEARRARARRVRDLFDRAIASLAVQATDEKTVVGTPFRSLRGNYSCLIPEGFAAVLPARYTGSTDFRFDHRKAGITVSIVSYPYDGILADLVEEMLDYYGDDIKVEQEEAKVLGGDGFTATITKDSRVTLIVGSVQNERAYRIHTHASKAALDEAKRAHAAFMKGFRAGP
ncbi:MAG: hypothetical protein ACYTEZ_02810 [Planctomycetota bacterium]|jgi:hypothetical protein